MEKKTITLVAFVHLFVRNNNTQTMEVVKSKAFPVLNQEPHHEDVLGQWKYSS
jgi:hypothetical protein